MYPHTPLTVMAEKHPPSPKREDGSSSFRRLRVKPAMTVQSKGLVLVEREEKNAYERNHRNRPHVRQFT